MQESVIMSNKFIHLLYVPTMACNMKCRYCYLDDQTVDDMKGKDCLETLKYAVTKFRKSGVVPFNISLHGGTDNRSRDQGWKPTY